MRSVFSILWIGSLVFILSCLTPEKENIAIPIDVDVNDSTARLIYDLQNKRDSRALSKFADSSSPMYRFLAAQAMASVQDAGNISDLRVLSEDSYQKIREEAAFAMGQSYDQEAIGQLMKMAGNESSHKVLLKVYEALGKCGSQNELNYLLSIDSEGNPELSFGQSLGIYRMALRNIVNTSAISKMTDFLDTTYTSQTRILASNYLARLVGVDLMDQLDIIVSHLSDDIDPVVRANMAIALNKTNSSRAREALIEALKDKDYRVRVNALRSLVYFNYDEVNDYVFAALKDPHIQVRIAASDFFLLITMRKDATKYALYASKMEDWLPKANLLKAALKFAEPALEVKINSFLKSKSRTEENPYAKGAFVEALSGDIKNYQLLASIAFSAERPVVTTAAMQGLNRMRIAEEFQEQITRADLDPEQVKQDFLQIYKKGINSGETTLTAVAAIAFRNPDLKYKSQIKDIEFLKNAQNNLFLPREIETFIELQKTINFFEGIENDLQPETPSLNPIDWEHVLKIKDHKKVKIKTTKGEMIVELYLEKAPGTVSYFLKLVERDFYDSLSFHRVVPNFVAQGGCPRGDGYGSTETSIKSEFANHYFKEGSLGIASSGKDTESCQWYVTHFPTFHLDGGYTNFASVVEGMEVAHQLEIGDRILDIELL